MKRILLIIYSIILAIGGCGIPLIMRLYFIYGGNRVWLSSFLQTAGFPIILLPLSFFYIGNRHIPDATDNTKYNNKMFSMETTLFSYSAFIGVMYGIMCYLYSYGLARLPVSTATLIGSTNLAFVALFAFLLVRQKFTAYSVNAIVLLIIGAGIIALHGSSDRPAGESAKQYAIGFVMSVIAAIMGASILPLTELMYKKAKREITYTLILEIQVVMGFFGSLFSIVGMIVNNDFKVISREARQFGLGETNYYLVLVGTAVICQVYFLGLVGVIYASSSLFSGIIVSMLLPVIEVLGVVIYKEKFKAEKGVSLALCLWGFASYFYGEFKQAKEMKKVNIPDKELPQNYCIANP
ncbi:hypothetical protein RIF29_10628 [Crotalaria pallida]|uniref:Probable purine permease n=1 Tax=Crotalaria pallida TaxID=3830 RepID=A0AAN9G074_CROPI